MRDLDIVRLRGRLGKDAETRTTTGDKKVTALSIAAFEKDSGEGEADAAAPEETPFPAEEIPVAA